MNRAHIFLSASCCAVLIAGALHARPATAQVQQAPAGSAIQVTSRLVVLDVTVLDRAGRPVVKGLNRDDFTVTEDGKPQTIRSFDSPETPDVRDSGAQDQGEKPERDGPATILVLDLLNSTFADTGYFRDELRKYLQEQPERLASPTELLVLGDDSLHSAQAYTHSRAALLAALKAVPANSSFEAMSANFYQERFLQSTDALEQISLQNNGIPGPKNIFWLGHGFTTLYMADYSSQARQRYFRFVHEVTNLLLEARMSLFAFCPPGNFMQSQTVRSANAVLGSGEPFAEAIDLGVFVNETGGRIFYNRNDLDDEMKQAQVLGSAYYTLTYRPPQDHADGDFRRIRVLMRNPALHALTRSGYFATGYFAPTGEMAGDARHSVLASLADAAQSTIPYGILDVTVRNLVRHPDSGTVQFTIALKSRDLVWNNEENGTSTTDVNFAAVSLDQHRNILASTLKMLTVTAPTQKPALLPVTRTLVPITVRVPKNSMEVRVVVQAVEGGRLGSVDLDRKMLESAPQAPTPNPVLIQRSSR